MTKKFTALIAFFLCLLPEATVFTAEISCPDFKCYFEREALKKEHEQFMQKEEQEVFRTNQLLLQEEELRERERQNELQEEELTELKEQTKLQEESLKLEKELQQKQQNQPNQQKEETR